MSNQQADSVIKIELSREEAAVLTACYAAIQSANAMVSEATAHLEKVQVQTDTMRTRYQARLKQAGQEICNKRGIEFVPVEQWDVSGLDTGKFEGSVDVPVKHKETRPSPETVSPPS